MGTEGPRTSPQGDVRYAIRVTAGYAWRLIVIAVAVYLIIAATNAVLVCMSLLILRVPLALPLALLTFFAAFVPLIGSPIALGVATLVALAARGPLTASAVLVLIVLIGQVEAHLLHPIVMSRAVNLHPLAVALSVATGTVLAGFLGAVVAVPMVAVAWTVWTEMKALPLEMALPSADHARSRAGSSMVNLVEARWFGCRESLPHCV